MKIINSSSEPEDFLIDKIKQTKIDKKHLKKDKKNKNKRKSSDIPVVHINDISSQSDPENIKIEEEK